MATTARKLEIRDFAIRVERLCDFLLAKISEENGRDGSRDQKMLEDLKEEAADIQIYHVESTTETVKGLYDFMHGVDPAPKEETK